MNRDLALEVSQAELGDKRLSVRAGQVVRALSAAPDSSLPDALKTDDALEAAYRLLRNPRVSWEALLKPHIRGTVARMAHSHNTLVIAHDTTEFSFPGRAPRAGLGQLPGDRQGFHGHFALGMELADICRPLGVVGVEFRFRPKERKGRRSSAQARRDPTTEAKRWGRLVSHVSEHFADAASIPVHVMDREADDYQLFDQMAVAGTRFVIRSMHDRATGDPNTPCRLSKLDFAGSAVLTRTVRISARHNTGDKAKHYPSRSARSAKLQVVAKRVQLLKPAHLPTSLCSHIDLNLVMVTETDVPDGQEPIVWRLWTTEPVDSEEDLARIVDIYRARWMIEEFFKALKTGCNYEKKQLESEHTLLNALGLYIPIACEILSLRYWSRSEEGQLPATCLMSDSTLDALSAATDKPLPAKPTICDALQAVARMGGHIKNNGNPGWIVLWRGYRKFLLFQMGWDALRQARKSPLKRCDQ